MGIGGSSIDYLGPFTDVMEMFQALLDDFQRYNDEDKFCSGLVALLSNNVRNGQFSEGKLANNEFQNEMCSTITRYYKIKIETINVAMKCLENSKRIISSLERGKICPEFFENDYICPADKEIVVILSDTAKKKIIAFFLDYIQKIEQLNDKNQLNKLENIDFTKVMIYHDTLLKITGNMLDGLKNYYTQILHNPSVIKLETEYTTRLREETEKVITQKNERDKRQAQEKKQEQEKEKKQEQAKEKKQEQAKEQSPLDRTKLINAIPTSKQVLDISNSGLSQISGSVQSNLQAMSKTVIPQVALPNLPQISGTVESNLPIKMNFGGGTRNNSKKGISSGNCFW